MKKKILVCILSLMVFGCTKQFDNKYDTTNSSYWANTYLFSNLIPRLLNPVPTSITSSNGTNQVVFYIGYSVTDTSLTVNTTANSYKIEGDLPTGIILNSSSGQFSGKPTSISAAKQYTVTACNTYGCTTGAVFIRVINATATRVYGQAGDFKSSTINNGGVSANSLSQPTAVLVDSAGGVYICDYGNGRILYYSSGSTTATRVYGQSGSFTTSTLATSTFSPTANTLLKPSGLALDSSGGLYVSDSGFHRILYYPSGTTTPSRVYGTGGSFTATVNASTTATTFNTPAGVAVDSADGLYVADNGNHRVLYFPSGTTTATRVYGQSGSFTTNTQNKNGRSETSFSNPTGVSLDSSGALYVTDQANHRVLYFPSGSTTATKVYAQNNFTTTDLTFTSTGISSPYVSSADSVGGLYVADYNRSRVLYYLDNTTKPILSYGQGGSLTNSQTYLVNGITTVSENSLQKPQCVFITSTGTVFICDSDSNRVLMY